MVFQRCQVLLHCNIELDIDTEYAIINKRKSARYDLALLKTTTISRSW